MKEMRKWKKKGNEDGSKQKTEKEVWWGKKGKGKREIDQREGRRGRKKGEKKKKKEFFPVFRLSELDGPRRKVDPCIASYA